MAALWKIPPTSDDCDTTARLHKPSGGILDFREWPGGDSAGSNPRLNRLHLTMVEIILIFNIILQMPNSTALCLPLYRCGSQHGS